MGLRMINRRFFTCEELSAKFDGNRATLDELVEFHGLRVYGKFYGARASHVDDIGFMDDSLRRSGRHELSKWEFSKSTEADIEEYDIGLMEYRLMGWFELSEEDTRLAITHGCVESPSPASYIDGVRLGRFFLIKSGLSSIDVRFLHSDINRIVSEAGSGDSSRTIESNRSTDKPIRSDRENNLLRVIAGLWALSSLPTEHHTAADKISALFDEWKWDKPAKSTIADNVLNEAAKLPGAKVRKSD